MTKKPVRPNTSAPLPKECIVWESTGKKSGAALYATDGVVIATMKATDNPTDVLADLLAARQSLRAVSGVLMLAQSAGLAQKTFSNAVQHDLLVERVTVCRAGNPDLKSSAEATLRKFWAQHYTMHTGLPSDAGPQYG